MHTGIFIPYFGSWLICFPCMWMEDSDTGSHLRDVLTDQKDESMFTKCQEKMDRSCRDV